MNLEGKVALITGGGGGIGQGIAQAFHEKGLKVVLADIHLDHALEQAAELGSAALAVALDVTSLQSWAEAKTRAEETFGRVDVLCNNAGISHPREPLDTMSADTFAKVIAVNTIGVYNGVVTFAPSMRAQGWGHIVNTSSMNGLLPFGTFAAYSASKFAVSGMSEALRDELAADGVGVSILYPGLTRSRMSLGDLEAGDIPPEIAAQGMMEPVWLGRAVVRAIEENQLHIITHPEYRGFLERRFQAILEAHGEPAQPGYRGMGAAE